MIIASDEFAREHRRASQSETYFDLLSSQSGNIRFSPAAGCPNRVATEGKAIVEAESFHGLSTPADFTFHHSRARRSRVDPEFLLPLKRGGLHCELASVRCLDAGQSGVFPDCPAEAGFGAVVAVEILEPDFVVGCIETVAMATRAGRRADATSCGSA